MADLDNSYENPFAVYYYMKQVKKRQFGVLTVHMKGRGGNGNTMEEVNVFKLYCAHVWNYYNEVLLYC
jgi:hypothetical protein